VAAIQQQVVNQQLSSSIILTNGTTTTTTTIFNSSRQRLQSTIPLLSFATTNTAHHEVINKTNLSTTRSLAHLIITIMICPLICILTIMGNLVVILTVCFVRKLQTASNILIVSLAVSDILVGLIIMPLAMGILTFHFNPINLSSFILVPEIANRWILGSIMCDIWTSTDVLLCSSSILNFLVISIDRYFIIKHPFKYAPMRTVKLLSLMITGVWILSALVSLPPVLALGRMYSRFIHLY
jgi:5-hydroxytryptamine receptor 7